MSDAPFEIDLKFLPDWLKESSDSDRYSQFEGDSGERRGRPARRDSAPRGRHPGDSKGGRGPRPERSGPERSGNGPRSLSGPRRGPGGRPQERGFRPARTQEPPPRPKIPVKVELLPEPTGIQGIIRQIKSGSRAYPFFGTARLFLEKPERYRVRITSLENSAPLFQVGEGPVGFDRAQLCRDAFERLRTEYYAENVIEGEPIKGAFKSVARCRSTGTVLGPTSFHGYQPALRKLYEERFSRRMSFREFQSEEIEMLNDEQAVNDWKEQARRSTSYTTLKESEPVTFKTRAEMEDHFKQTYLPGLLKSAACIDLNGAIAGRSHDRDILAGIRDAWERERNFPASLIYHLRPRLLEAGLQIFKHKKRVFFVSPVRPQRHAQGQLFSDGIAAILAVLEKHPRLNRPQLASHVLGASAQADSPETVARKESLASDLHYLVHAGHVIEFHDGTLDLPLSPKAEQSQENSEPSAASGPETVPTDAVQADQEPHVDSALSSSIPAQEPVESSLEENPPGEMASADLAEPSNPATGAPATDTPVS
jgi:hypothetical protein